MNVLFSRLLKKTALVLIAASVISANALVCNAAGKIEYSDNLLTLVAENEPLIPLLEKIAKKTNIVIFISKGMTAEKCSVRIDSLPLEKALNKMLKGLNVAMVYHDESGQPRVTAVKIYPKGKFSGPLDVVIQTSIPDPSPSSEEPGQRYASSQSDTLQPQEYARTVEYDALVATAVEFEQKEEAAWEDIQTLKNQINDEVDETKNEVLSLALLDKYEAFENLQKSHISLLEKMHRVEHFMESKANKDKQK
ncbi:MAG: hypothetical protein ABIJ31_14040 [Pseudomonadota bacterium]